MMRRQNPFDLAHGLSSVANRRWAIGILRKSTKGEIASLLRAVDFQPVAGSSATSDTKAIPKGQADVPRPKRDLADAEGPPNRARGLASAVNRQWTADILDKSTPAEIAAVLREVDYKPTADWVVLPDVERKIELEKRVREYLATEEGQSEFVRLKKDFVEKEAQRWAASEEGRVQIENLKTILATDSITADEEFFARACRQKVLSHVERWLNSPLGQETVEQERQRAVRGQVQPPPRRKDNSWIQATVKEIS